MNGRTILRVGAALAALLLGLSFTACYPAARWFLELPPYRAEAGIEREEQVPMRDGVQLATDVYLPKPSNGTASWPTILIRTPYSKSGVPLFLETAARFFVRYGYAVVAQDVRGRHESEGEWYPLLHELDDGLDTAHWVLGQPWCNGKLGLIGASYLTVTAWLIADQVPEAVKAMVLAVGSLDPYTVSYRRGMLKYDVIGSWMLAMHTKTLTLFDVRKFDPFVRHLPPSGADEATVGTVPFYDDVLKHPGRDDYWSRYPQGVAERARAPVLMLTGWYDFFLRSQISDFQKLGSRDRSRMLIGPWTHIGGFFEDPDLYYGNEAAAYHAVKYILEWFDMHLLGMEPQYKWGPVRTFAIGANRWSDSPTWPPPGSNTRTFYLGGEGTTKACRGGSLGPSPAKENPSDRFIYDPRNPVPTVGGSLLAWVLGVRGYPANAKDQMRVCTRNDVLSYLTEPLSRPLELAGPIEARLWVESTVEDTAFTAKLVDVSPSGPAVNIQDGITTLAYHDSESIPLRTEAGTIVEIVIDLQDTHWVLQAGHRLRLDVSSSNFPQYHRHPNRFGLFGDVSELLPATQTLHHDSDHPSRVHVTVLN